MTTNNTFVLGKDSFFAQGTIYVERVTSSTIVTTSDVTKALGFSSEEEVKSFAGAHGIRLCDFASTNPDENTENYCSVFVA